MWLLSCFTDSRDAPQSVQMNCSFSATILILLTAAAPLLLSLSCLLLGGMLNGNSETNKIRIFHYLVSSMTMIVVVESESDKPTGWGVEKHTELNYNLDLDYLGNMYSEINHSLDPIHIFKFELFKFGAFHSS